MQWLTFGIFTLKPDKQIVILKSVKQKFFHSSELWISDGLLENFQGAAMELIDMKIFLLVYFQMIPLGNISSLIFMIWDQLNIHG